MFNMVPVGDAQVLVAVLYICYSALHPFRMDPLPSLWNVLPHLSSSNDIASSLHPVNISLTLGIQLDIIFVAEVVMVTLFLKLYLKQFLVMSCKGPNPHVQISSGDSALPWYILHLICAIALRLHSGVFIHTDVLINVMNVLLDLYRAKYSSIHVKGNQIQALVIWPFVAVVCS